MEDLTDIKKGPSRKKGALLLTGLALALIFIGVIVWALATASPWGGTPVVLSEIMTSNTSYPDSKGRLCDWIELHNRADYAVSLRGYTLSDNLEGAKYTFPEDASIPAGGYYVVSCIRDGGEDSANFALSREGGEVVSLTDGNGTLADRVITRRLDKNTSMIPGEKGVWEVCLHPTPGYANAAAGRAAYEAARSRADTGIVLSEVMADNAGAAADENGNWGDWVEITNTSPEKADLTGWFLTDDPAKPTRYTLPQVLLEPGESLLIWADGGDTGLHAGFKLSSSGETLELRTPDGRLADSLTYPPLGANMAWQRQADGSFLAVEGGTPGRPETGSDKSDSPLRITEIMPRNLTVAKDDKGMAWDWVEITNMGEMAVETGAYSLTDDPEVPRMWQLPEGRLEPGECLLVYAAGGEAAGGLYAPFALSAGERLALTDGRGLTADSLTVPETEENFAWQRQHDGSFAAVRGGTPGSAETGEPAIETDVYISEVMADNTLTFVPGAGTADWVELASAGEGADLTDWWLSKDADDPFQWRISGMALEAGGYAVAAASGEGESFRLSAKGESLALYTPDGALASEMTFGASEPDQAYARSAPGGTPEATFYATPGQPNSAAGWLEAQRGAEIPAGLYISEVMTGNRTLSLGAGGYYDWVELTNGGTEEAKLSEYALGDRDDPNRAVTLPGRTLQPGERTVVLCTGEDRPGGNRLTLPLKLNDIREGVYLYKGETLIDGLLAFDLPAGGSIGRMPGEGGVFRFAVPTPGEENTGGVREISGLPEASLPQGVYDRESVTVTLSGPGRMRYTLDGSVPTEGDAAVTGPLQLNGSAALRVRCWEEGKLPGETATFHYILNEGHTLPVLCLALDPEDMFGHYTGIYVAGAHKNYFQDWEKVCNLAYFDGKGSVSLDCGLKMHGAGSRETSQKKSLKVNFRGAYGAKTLEYDLFGNGRTSFDSLVIRAGEDYNRAFIREELFTSLAAEGCPELITQDFQYVALYLNGEFFGIFCMKERLNADTYAEKIHVPEETCQVVSAGNGLGRDFMALYQYAYSHDMTDPECFAYMEERVDFDSVIDWTVFEAYSGNPDISGNVRYAYSSEEGKWRFCLYDLDWAFGQGRLSFTRLLTGRSHYNVFFNALIRNPVFRDRFLSRTAELLDGVLANDHVFARIDELAAIVEPEMPREKEKWGSSVKAWRQRLGYLKTYLEIGDRRAELIADLRTAIRLTAEERQRYFGG